MKATFLAAAAILAAQGATAGGIERTRNDYSILFEEGNRVSLSFTSVAPDVSGDYPVGLGGGSTGDMAVDYNSASFAYKRAFSDKVDFALMVNHPYLADASYGSGIYTGLTAKWDSMATSAVVRVKTSDRLSVFGGARLVQSAANIVVPAALVAAAGGPNATYVASGTDDTQVGLIAGVGYEIPDIALRVVLSYEARIEHSLPTTETIGGGLATAPDTTTIELPQAVTLDFQTGIAEDTLLFGSIRWAEWSNFAVAPTAFTGLSGSPIVSFDHNTTTLRLGIGRRINEDLSVFAQVGREKANGGIASRLSPTDGFSSVGFGARYSVGNATITGGVEFVRLGDAVDSQGTNFTDNSAVGMGLGVSFAI